jgi:uncharacterized protein YjiK
VRISELPEASGVAVSCHRSDSRRRPQGEGVAFATDGTLYLTGDGGGKLQPGTFARFACSVKSRGQD